MRKSFKITSLSVMFFGLFYVESLLAMDVQEKVFIQYFNAINHPLIIEVLTENNLKHQDYSTEDCKEFDKNMLAQIRAGDISPVLKILNGSASQHLRSIKEKHNEITEIIIADQKGINAAQSDLTSDYWQGDEDKFTKAFYAATPETIYISPLEFDESTQTYQRQISQAIFDEDNQKIGVVIIGIEL